MKEMETVKEQRELNISKLKILEWSQNCIAGLKGEIDLHPNDHSYFAGQMHTHKALCRHLSRGVFDVEENEGAPF